MNSWTAAAAGTTAVSTFRKTLFVGLMAAALALGGCGGGGGGGSDAPVGTDSPIVQPQDPASPDIDEPGIPVTPPADDGDDAIPEPEQPGDGDTGGDPVVPPVEEPEPPEEPQDPQEPEQPDEPVPDDDEPVVPPVVNNIWLSWRAPTERENGDALALSELRGYRIHYGPLTNPTAYTVDVNDPSVTAYTLEDLNTGTYQVAVSAIDTDGLESGLSNTLTKVIN